MKVCPNCGKVIGFNSYFGAYICDECGWEDDSYYKERALYFSKKRDFYENQKKEFELTVEHSTELAKTSILNGNNFAKL